jgi:hypothetical protein
MKTQNKNQEWVLKRGYELIPRKGAENLKWYHFIIFFSVIDEICFYKKQFLDLINEKGEVRRIYQK